MSKELGPREKQLREQREAQFAARNKPNPFEDAARGRDPAPKSSDGSVESRHAAMAANPLVGNVEAKKVGRSISRSAGVTPGPSGAKSNRPAHKIIEGLKEAIAVVRGEAEPAKVTVVKVGRPKKGEKRDKPWEALGISKASYYRRQAKSKGETR